MKNKFFRICFLGLMISLLIYIYISVSCKQDLACENFRPYIQIFQDRDGNLCTPYDFQNNKLVSTDTIFVDKLNGSDFNSGKSPLDAKQTLGTSLLPGVTIFMQKGIYVAGVDFNNGMELKDMNIIGNGDVCIDNNYGEPFCVTGDIYVENICFLNGNYGSLRTYICDTTSRCTFVRCKFNSSVIDNEDVSKAKSLGGLRAQGGTYYLYQCEASYNGYDGFNYHSTTEDKKSSFTSPHVVEVECVGYHNGEKSNYHSCNGSTAHDGARILRLNCSYAYCNGGIIADVNAGTKSLNLCCHAWGSTNSPKRYNKYNVNYFCASGATMILYKCSSANSEYDLSCMNDGVVYFDEEMTNVYNDGGTLRKYRSFDFENFRLR